MQSNPNGEGHQNGAAMPIMQFQSAAAAAASGLNDDSQSQRNSPHPPQVFIRGIAGPAAGTTITATADSNIDPAIAGVSYRFDPEATHYVPPGFSIYPGPPHIPDDDMRQDDGSPDEWKPQKDGSRSRKPRREKPKIELAADQPPTTQGKPRARVYVACAQWFVLPFLSTKVT